MDNQDNNVTSLEERIKKAKGEDIDPKMAERMKDAENMSNGMRAGAELMGSIAGGAFIGWLLDQWLETAPIMLIVFLLLGIGTGFYNVYKTTQNIGTNPGFSELHRREKTAKDNEKSDQPED